MWQFYFFRIYICTKVIQSRIVDRFKNINGGSHSIVTMSMLSDIENTTNKNLLITFPICNLFKIILYSYMYLPFVSFFLGVKSFLYGH